MVKFARITPYALYYHVSIEIEISNNYPNTYEPRATRTYRQVSNISRTLAGNENVDHSDVVVGAAPTTSEWST